MVKTNSLLLIVNLVFGAYLLNKGLNLIVLPEVLLPAEKIIFVIAGGLLIIAGFLSSKTSPQHK